MFHQIWLNDLWPTPTLAKTLTNYGTKFGQTKFGQPHFSCKGGVGPVRARGGPGRAPSREGAEGRARMVGPKPRNMRPEGWRPKRWGPSGGASRVGSLRLGPEGWEGQNFAFFSLSRHNFLSFFLFLGSFWCLKRRGPEMCTFGVLGLSCEARAVPKLRCLQNVQM